MENLNRKTLALITIGKSNRIKRKQLKHIVNNLLEITTKCSYGKSCDIAYTENIRRRSMTGSGTTTITENHRAYIHIYTYMLDGKLYIKRYIER